MFGSKKRHILTDGEQAVAIVTDVNFLMALLAY
jgi:hypothetical protein